MGRRQGTEFFFLNVVPGQGLSHPFLASLHKEGRTDTPSYIFETTSNFTDFCHATHSLSCPFYQVKMASLLLPSTRNFPPQETSPAIKDSQI